MVVLAHEVGLLVPVMVMFGAQEVGVPVPEMVTLGSQELGMPVPEMVVFGAHEVGVPQVVMLLETYGMIGVGPYQMGVVGVAEGMWLQTRS